MDPIEKHHAHLDLCEQCREHPFEPCEGGAKLLVAAGEAACRELGWSSPTGRAPTEPEMQSIPIRTERGKQIREAFREFTGPIRPLDTPGLEVRLHANLHAHEKKRDCIFCEMGIPFDNKEKA